MLNKTNDVPSFNKLSPSKIIFNLCGAFNSFNNEETAIGSVDPKIEAITNNPMNEIWFPKPIIFKIKAKENVQIKTPKNANKSIDFKFLLNMNKSLL